MRPIVTAALLMTLLFTLAGCGDPHTPDTTTQIRYYGLVRDTLGRPASNVLFYLYQTNESSSTNDQGQFELESFERFSEVDLYAQGDSFSNRVRIEAIPETAQVVSLEVTIDLESTDLTLNQVTFSDSIPKPTPGPTGPPTTPSDGNFDNQGNTSAFGIPEGLKGNIGRGRSEWQRSCASCHRRDKSRRNYSQLVNSFERIPEMRSLRSLGRDKVADLVAYLNRGSR